MAITAKLKYLRMSPRKVRLAADLVRGLEVADAELYLEKSPKRAAAVVLKLLRSAVANAEHNSQKDRATLFVQALTVDGGPTIKRYRARAFGRAADIHKRTSHVVLTLGERAGAAKKKRFVPRAEKKKEGATPTLEELSRGRKTETVFRKKEAEKESAGGIRKRAADIGRRFFRRKSV